MTVNPGGKFHVESMACVGVLMTMPSEQLTIPRGVAVGEFQGWIAGRSFIPI